MSDEGFLRRWSRKKRTETPDSAAEGTSPESPPSQPSPAARGREPLESLPPQSVGRSLPKRAEGLDGGASTPPAPKAEDEAIDPATLPPIESLGPASDYTVFLKKGVPETLRLAALRKAWMSDPFIRDFRSPAIDYGWDFTTPEYSLRASDDVGRMLDKIFPPAPTDAAKPAAASPPGPGPAPTAVPEPVAAAEPLRLPQKQAAITAAQPTAELQAAAEAAPAISEIPRRKHGGALPDKAD
jgi:hypothetical protein